MSLWLWACVTTMTVLAIAIVARPLVRANCIRATGVIALALPAVAAAFYSQLGSPDAAVHYSSAHASLAEKRTGHGKVGSVASMVEALAARLQSDPDDAGGWLLLARSYEHLGRMDDAGIAYARAKELGAGGSEFFATEENESKSTQSEVAGSVQLSERAMTYVSPHDQVFIFARAPDSAGPPAAVLRRSVSELPLEFRLNDSHAMIESVKLSDFNEVVITARISRSGAATETLQNLEAKSGSVPVTDQERVDLVIE